jgi:Big-like domain-containing protein
MWTFVLAFIMATCSGGGGGGGTPPAPVLPTVRSTSPAAGATNVAINTVIAAAFSGEMDAATINGTTFTLSNGVNGAVTYDATNFIATFAPAGNLASNTTYTATITTGVRDKAGNAMASNFEWNFTTGSTLDTSLPQVLSATPSAGASSIPVNTALTVLFSEAMDATSINGATFTLSNGMTGSVTYDATNHIAKYNPSGNLASNTTYTATITTGVRDLAGNALANNFVWSFTTGSASDTTPPIVSSITPAAGASFVPVNTSITSVFSEAMDAATINGTSFTLSSGVTGAVTYDAINRAATFAPSGSLAYNTTYTATITSGVRDLAGNALAQDFTWNFTTLPIPAAIQAARTFSAVLGAQSLMDAQFSAVMALGQNSLPAGFAPGLSKSRGGDIGSIDPTLSSIVENMQRLLLSAAIQGAVRKAGARTAQFAPVNTTLTTEFCSNADGSVAITGTNNYDDALSTLVTFSYDMSFTNCRDDIALTRLDGILHIEGVQSTDNDATTSSLTANNLTEKQFSSSAFDVMTQQSVMNGSFVINNQVSTIAKTASGSFVVTTPAQGAATEKAVTLTYTGLVENSSLTHNVDASDTNVTTSAGTIMLGVTQGGAVTLQMTLGISLEDKTQLMNDVAGTRKNWINGTMDATWVPDLSQAGCKTGSLTFLTNAPSTFTLATGLCPVSGTMMMNDATVTYGIPVMVTAGNGETQSFPDCNALNQAGVVCLP